MTIVSPALALAGGEVIGWYERHEVLDRVDHVVHRGVAVPDDLQRLGRRGLGRPRCGRSIGTDCFSTSCPVRLLGYDDTRVSWLRWIATRASQKLGSTTKVPTITPSEERDHSARGAL